KLYRWFELSVVLIISFGSALLNSLEILRSGLKTLPNPQNSGWTFAIAQESGSLLLLGYILSRRRLRFRDLGLRWSLHDLGIGLMVAVASYLTYLAGHYLLYVLLTVFHSHQPTGPTVREIFGHP